jgi:hypothetical protein
MYTIDMYLQYSLHKEGGGEVNLKWSEGKGALVYMKSRKYQHDWLYLQSINSLNTSKDDI